MWFAGIIRQLCTGLPLELLRGNISVIWDGRRCMIRVVRLGGWMSGRRRGWDCLEQTCDEHGLEYGAEGFWGRKARRKGEISPWVCYDEWLGWCDAWVCIESELSYSSSMLTSFLLMISRALPTSFSLWSSSASSQPGIFNLFSICNPCFLFSTVLCFLDTSPLCISPMHIHSFISHPLESSHLLHLKPRATSYRCVHQVILSHPAPDSLGIDNMYHNCPSFPALGTCFEYQSFPIHNRLIVPIMVIRVWKINCGTPGLDTLDLKQWLNAWVFENHQISPLEIELQQGSLCNRIRLRSDLSNLMHSLSTACGSSRRRRLQDHETILGNVEILIENGVILYREDKVALLDSFVGLNHFDLGVW